jgi:hypothetical protein
MSLKSTARVEERSPDIQGVLKSRISASVHAGYFPAGNTSIRIEARGGNIGSGDA